MAFKITDNCIGCEICKKNCIVFAITGRTKQKHVINQKRCIECGVCGRVCPKDSIVDKNGTVIKYMAKSLWGKIAVDADLCSACSICVDTCNFGALRISTPKHKGDLKVYAELFEPKNCVSCELCKKRCPLGAISVEYPNKEEKSE